MKLLMLIPFLWSCLVLNDLIIEKGELVLRVNNVEQAGGMVWIGVYDSQNNFLIQENAILVHGVKVNMAGELVMRLDSIPYGTYAIAIFHDENNSGYMDQNFIGIPLEPYGFSVPYSSKWRVPKFEDVKFEFNRTNQVIETDLARW
ncbi:MAG: hypothetical protein ACI85O_001260 [Saprospiraceae bacterium]|jgi:uncharacterized protein (DUF2141 family)